MPRTIGKMAEVANWIISPIVGGLTQRAAPRPEESEPNKWNSDSPSWHLRGVVAPSSARNTARMHEYVLQLLASGSQYDDLRGSESLRVDMHSWPRSAFVPTASPHERYGAIPTLEALEKLTRHRADFLMHTER